MAKIMHISDLHLDSKIIELTHEKSEIRRMELKKSFENAIEYAKTHGAEILLIAGDIFDNEFAKKSTVLFVKQLLNSLDGIDVFISPGNHDPYITEIYSELEDGLNSNIKIFKNAMECVELKDKNVRIYGRGFETECIDAPLLKGFKAIDDDMVNIMVIHGEITGSDSHYNPVSISDIKESGLDYLALGHTHTFSQISKAGDTFYAYSGTHEGHGFDELGEKGFIFGDVLKGKADLNFVPSQIRKYECIEIDVSDCEIIEDIVQKIKPQINENDLFKIILKGSRNENLTINEMAIKSLVDAFFIKIYDRTKIKTDFEKISKEKNLKGTFVKNVLGDINDENREKMEKILEKIAEFF